MRTLPSDPGVHEQTHLEQKAPAEQVPGGGHQGSRSRQVIQGDKEGEGRDRRRRGSGGAEEERRRGGKGKEMREGEEGKRQGERESLLRSGKE